MRWVATGIAELGSGPGPCAPVRLHEIMCVLASQPERGIEPGCLFWPERHFRRNCRVPVEHPREGVAGDTEHPRRFGHVQTDRIETGHANAAPGMRRFAHRHGSDSRQRYSVRLTS